MCMIQKVMIIIFKISIYEILMKYKNNMCVALKKKSLFV